MYSHLKKSLSAFTFALALGVGGLATAGPVAEATEPAPILDPFAEAIRPVTAPTLFDLALPRTQIHPIFMNQNLSKTMSSSIGKLPVGGDFHLYAIQAELALTERFSLVALKDGYIDLNPDSTLSGADGWANLSAGIKWAFYYNPEKAAVASLNIQVEAPTGNSEVAQGEGDGAINPAISALKLWGPVQFAHSLGFRIPFTDSESTMLHYGAHLSYALTERISPLLEVNYYRTLKAGDGSQRFDQHVGGAVPAVLEFEGADLINFGAANAMVNKDIVTLGAGFRFKVNDAVSLGAAYEIPLTDESDNLMQNRVTVDCVIQF